MAIFAGRGLARVYCSDVYGSSVYNFHRRPMYRYMRLIRRTRRTVWYPSWPSRTMWEQWRNSDFAAVSRRPTAAAAGAQVRLLKKLSRTFFRQKMTYSSKKQFF